MYVPKVMEVGFIGHSAHCQHFVAKTIQLQNMSKWEWLCPVMLITADNSKSTDVITGNT